MFITTLYIFNSKIRLRNMSRNFDCPYCNKEQPFFAIFKMRLQKYITCYKCNNEIIPCFHKLVAKTWFKMPIIGIFIGIIPAQLALYNGIPILKALFWGLMIGIILILIYMWIIFITTTFRK